MAERAMKQIKVKLVRSRIGTTPHQRKCLDALGLGKMQKTKTFNDTPAIRGIIRKVPHLVSVEEE
ncbi:MAG: 50S ribosomal protein L30 [Desulfovibrio sp.]|nr:50S ribosomal protein L30 [Desulfovibrio sp.]